MTTIYLVRHAEAEGNVYRRCHGQYNALLTGKAYRQIEALARRFDDVKIDAVYASDLFRARVTAQGIAQRHGLPVQTDRELREIDMGEWEDRPWGELPRLYPEAYARWMQEPWNCRVPGGESVQQSGERLLRALRRLAHDHPGQTLVVASHGTGIRAALCLALGQPLSDMGGLGWCDNTAVAKLLFAEDGQIQVEYYNDNSHLPEELSTFAGQRWWKTGDRPLQWNMRFAPVDWGRDLPLVEGYVRDCCAELYGSGVDAGQMIEQMRRQSAACPDSAALGYVEDTPIALVSLDVEREADTACGWIGLYYVAPDYRGMDYAPQLLGHAISVYRRMGKRQLKVRLPKGDERALAFFRRYNFEPAGQWEGPGGVHDVWVKDIAYPAL